MNSLRAKNFNAIQNVHSELKNLVKRTNKQVKDSISISRFVSGLKKLSKSISRLVSYGASDDAYLQCLV